MPHLFRQFLPEKAVSTVQFFPRRCLRSRCSTFSCRICLQVCPSDALQLIEGRISFDASSCTACMRCTAVCPNDALAATSVDLAKVLFGLSAGGEVFFSCDRQPRRKACEIVLPCVGLFSAEALLALLVNNRGVVIFNLAACQGCPNQESSSFFAGTLERVRQLCQPLVIGQVQLLHDDDNHGNLSHRRDFLSNLTGKAWKGAAYLADFHSGAQTVDDSRRRVSDRRRLVQHLVNGLDAIGRDLLRRLCMPQIRLLDSCRLCPRCAGICPSAALHLERTGDGKKLLYDGMRCSGCGLCVFFCPEDALELVQAPLIAGSECPSGESGICPAENLKAKETG